jgi:hypothetical protein
MFDVSHPCIRHAQHIADKTGTTQLIVPNFIGGFDIVRPDTGVWVEALPVAKVEPRKRKIALCFHHKFNGIYHAAIIKLWDKPYAIIKKISLDYFPSSSRFHLLRSSH